MGESVKESSGRARAYMRTYSMRPWEVRGADGKPLAACDAALCSRLRTIAAKALAAHRVERHGRG